MIALRSGRGEACLSSLSASLWLGFSPQHPTTHCWLSEQNTAQGFWSVRLFLLANISNSEIGKGTPGFHGKLIGVNNPKSLCSCAHLTFNLLAPYSLETSKSVNTGILWICPCILFLRNSKVCMYVASNVCKSGLKYHKATLFSDP